MKSSYKETYPLGSRVRVADRTRLDQFLAEWLHHDPLVADQLAHAGKLALVKEVGFYHGGDPLYVLEGLPGVWHGQCLAGAV